ncbi:MAG: alpha/beta hydrolase [Legionellales bacterium]
MQFIDKLDIPGEHPLVLNGVVGQLEAVLTVPAKIDSPYVAFLGHPHSLQGGTMNNKVVTTMARVFKELNIPSLRFNFRGVGLSEGVYDAGLGESDDMMAQALAWQKEQMNRRFIFAGFSFGSYVAYRAAAQLQPSMLITIAPSVQHYNYNEFTPYPDSWLLVHGDEDELVPVAAVLDFVQQFQPALPLIQFANTGHFFHGKLLELKAKLMDYVHAQIHSA